MVKNLGIATILLLSILVSLFVYDYLQMPSKSLVIFYTSNLRGQIQPFSGTVEDRHYEQIGGLAFLKGFINEKAKPFGFDTDNVLLLDTGDAIFGTAEATLTMGETPLKLMGKTGYDAMAIGNMEFEFGFDALKNYAQREYVPMLACNYRDVTNSTGISFKPGIIVEKAGVKVGIIGLGQEDISRNTRIDNIVNLEVSDMKASVQKTASDLKEKGAEVIVLISHHPNLGKTEKLSSVFPDVDIIIGDLIGPASTSFGEKPLVCQTAPGRGAGVGIVKVQYQGGRWQIEQGLHRIFAIDATKIKPDANLVQEISKFEAKIDNLLEEVITHSKGRFTHSYMEESTIGHLLADSMKESANADVALTNSGGIKSAFNEGSITLRNLYELIPFENNIVTVELSGYELEDLIEQGLSGPKSGFLQSSGIECKYASLNPAGSRIIQIDINEKPLEVEATYTVAINDFMHSNFIDWPELAFGKNPKIKGMVRESFKNYLVKRPEIIPLTTPNYEDIEEDYLMSIPLTSEIATLFMPVTQENSNFYQYSTLLSETIRQETGADFAFVPTSIVKKTRIPLKSVSVARVFSDIKSKAGVSILELNGSDIRKILNQAVKVKNISFSGVSIEKTESSFNILPWNVAFKEDGVYKVAVNENFDFSFLKNDVSNYKPVKRFSDIRRTFINCLKRNEGKVELKRAIF